MIPPDQMSNIPQMQMSSFRVDSVDTNFIPV